MLDVVGEARPFPTVVTADFVRRIHLEASFELEPLGCPGRFDLVLDLETSADDIESSIATSCGHY